jgi:hypothetical protein
VSRAKYIRKFLHQERLKRNELTIHARVAAQCARRTFTRMEASSRSHPQWLRLAFHEILEDLEAIAPEASEYGEIPNDLVNVIEYGELMTDQRHLLLVALKKALAVGSPRDDASGQKFWAEAQAVLEKIEGEKQE